MFALKKFSNMKVKKMPILPSKYTFWGQNRLNHKQMDVCEKESIQLFLYLVQTFDYNMAWLGSTKICQCKFNFTNMVRLCQAVRSINSVSYQKTYVLYAKVLTKKPVLPSTNISTNMIWIDLCCYLLKSQGWNFRCSGFPAYCKVQSCAS